MIDIKALLTRVSLALEAWIASAKGKAADFKIDQLWDKLNRWGRGK